jgi:hypothetical protein
VTKHPYLLAIGCYLLIPVAVIAGFRLSFLIDPEMARGHADYARNFRLLQMVQLGVVIATGALALALWSAVCYLVLKSRQRSLLWLLLAAAGPFGFIAIAMLEDRSPDPDDQYQQFTRKLKLYARVPLEAAVFVSVWVIAFLAVQVKGDLMIRYVSATTGTPVATLLAEQTASSGMWAFREGLEMMYLVVLIYLLWPVLFNLSGRLFKARASSAA